MRNWKKTVFIGILAILTITITACNRNKTQASAAVSETTAAEQTDFTIYGVWRYVGSEDEAGRKWYEEGSPSLTFYNIERQAEEENCIIVSGNSINHGVLEGSFSGGYYFTNANWLFSVYSEERPSPIHYSYNPQTRRLSWGDFSTLSTHYYEWVSAAGNPPDIPSSTQSTDAGPYPKIINGDLSDFAGTWVRHLDEGKAQLSSNGVFDEGIRENGLRALRFRYTGDGVNETYRWIQRIEEDDFDGIGVTLYLPGAPVYRHNSYNNDLFETDITKARIAVDTAKTGDWIYYREEESLPAVLEPGHSTRSDISISSGEEHWYSVTLTGSHYDFLLIETVKHTAHIVFEAYDADYSPIEYNTYENHISINIYGIKAGTTYFIKIKGKSSGSYRISAREVEAL